jgi:hypothetical protein
MQDVGSAPTGDPEVRFFEVARRPILHGGTSVSGLPAAIASPSPVDRDASNPGSGPVATVKRNAVVKSPRPPSPALQPDRSFTTSSSSSSLTRMYCIA